jgi:hypothetical protein
MTQPCGHDERWLAYRNPVDANSERYCLFCEVERLQSIVDRYTSTTADGVRVGPGDFIFNREGRELRMTRYATCPTGKLMAYPDVCYSTLEAAEAARKEA